MDEIKNIDEIAIYHKSCARIMALESQAPGNRTAIYSCPFCKKQVRVKI